MCANTIVIPASNPDDPFVDVIQEAPETDIFNAEVFLDAHENLSLSPISPRTGATDFRTIAAVAAVAAAPSATPASSTVHVAPSKPVGGRLSKFGAVKVANPVNFDEIEAQARMGRERLDRPVSQPANGFVSASVPTTAPVSPTESGDSRASQPTPSTVIPGNKSSAPPPSIPSTLSVPAPPSKKQQEVMDRLGMGMRKMSVSQTTTAEVAGKCKQGISSDLYARQSADLEHDSFVNDRLREIDTTKGISSDAFFGRNSARSPTDDHDDAGSYSSQSGYSNNSKPPVSNLKNSAREFASRLAERASSIDMRGVKQSISSAGTRLSSYLQDLQVRRHVCV